MRNRHKLAVVLFQLGGPDSLEAIEPFLYNLFCDPDIIDFPLAPLGAAASRRSHRRAATGPGGRIGSPAPLPAVLPGHQRQQPERVAAAVCPLGAPGRPPAPHPRFLSPP